ncbi:invasion associated locus B family protein [Starkeya koreensis]|uniref:Invasion associated locus B family protein n=1 Tax=Ancylobacter koreensis TaxID=266121 RepID=A0ABT0DRG3_9HYPH|nr:invasion associated locus B family protein [Ancylobacter koreensis]MCK0209873.1 invasion associated locus B family protein [Ancylobacter koreensis]
MFLSVKLAAPLALILPLALAVAQPASAQTAAPVKTESKAEAPKPRKLAPAQATTKTFGQWSVTCRERLDVKDRKSCTASLKVLEARSKKVALLWQIGRNPAGEPAFLFRTPLGVRLDDGLEISLDGGAARHFHFASCSSNGCHAVGAFDEAFAKELAGAREAVASFTFVDGQVLKVALPLDGIDQALPALKG